MAIPDWHHFTESDSFSSVIRDGERLGIITGQYIRVRSDYLADVFSLSGHGFAATIPRLKQLAQIPELGMPRELAVMSHGSLSSSSRSSTPNVRSRSRQRTSRTTAIFRVRRCRACPRSTTRCILRWLPCHLRFETYPDEARSDTASARGDGSRPVLPETTNDGPTYHAP